jgi:hypothetical protein
MVFFPSARDNHVVAEAQGHVGYQFQGFQTKPVIAQALFQCTQDHEEYLQAYVRRFLRLRAQAPIVPNEIVVEAMIKGLRPGPTAQYFARKPPQTLEKLLQKMDEYIRADNDFRKRREEAYRFYEMTRGFRGRIHPRHIRSIHSSTQNDDKGSQLQRPQYTSQSSGQQQSSFRPLAPRGRGARGFGGRYGDQPRKIYCLFYGEDKGHTTRMCQITILKQKEIAEAESRQNQPKQVLHTASCHSPYIPEYVGNHPAASFASASHSQASWPQLPPPLGVGILKPKTEPEPEPNLNRPNCRSIRVFGFGFSSYMCYISGMGMGSVPNL